MPPTNSLSVNGYLTAEAAMILVRAYAKLKELGFEPVFTANLCSQPKETTTKNIDRY